MSRDEKRETSSGRASRLEWTESESGFKRNKREGRRDKAVPKQVKDQRDKKQYRREEDPKEDHSHQKEDR